MHACDNSQEILVTHLAGVCSSKIKKERKENILNIKRQTKSQSAGQNRCWAGWSLTWARTVKMRTERAARDCWHIKLTPDPLSCFCFLFSQPF